MSKKRFGIVAGEPSGDFLGACLIKSLQEIYPDAEFIGVAGDKMSANGAVTLFPMEKLSVMGFTEVFCRLRELLSCRKRVKQHFIAHPPDVYIGIDSPDFNLPIEKALKRRGIKTVHCNSPTIWAWREKRIHSIKQATDLMLVLFPFEKKYYTQGKVAAEYIGHPLADIIPLEYRTFESIRHLALLPGSRAGEIKYIGPVLIQAIQLMARKYPDIRFSVPLINQDRYIQFKSLLEKNAPELKNKVHLSVGNARELMQQSDLVILASGTATLEALLLKKPMIVVYKSSEVSFRIAKSLIKIEHISLPNILAGKPLVPELIQQQATPDNIIVALENYMHSTETLRTMQEEFLEIHRILRCDAADKAARAISQLIE